MQKLSWTCLGGLALALSLLSASIVEADQTALKHRWIYLATNLPVDKNVEAKK